MLVILSFVAYFGICGLLFPLDSRKRGDISSCRPLLAAFLHRYSAAGCFFLYSPLISRSERLSIQFTRLCLSMALVLTMLEHSPDYDLSVVAFVCGALPTLNSYLHEAIYRSSVRRKARSAAIRWFPWLLACFVITLSYVTIYKARGHLGAGTGISREMVIMVWMAANLAFIGVWDGVVGIGAIVLHSLKKSLG